MEALHNPWSYWVKVDCVSMDVSCSHMTHRIISISGFKGHGKDTVGNMLAAQAGYQPLSFADPLKKMLAIQFGWDPHLLSGITPESRAWREQPDAYWSEKLHRPFTPRRAMTEIGTDLIRRRFLDSQWCDLMQKQLQSRVMPVVITDARFRNELQMIRDQGGITVWVKRDPLPDWHDKVMWLNKRPTWQRKWIRPFLRDLKHVHESEQDWVGWHFDHVIENTGTLADLSECVQAWHKQLT